jgi:hypothetical protein
MPTTYMDGSVTTDTILTLDSNYVALMRCKVFFPGNGVDAYTVLSAFFTQDTHSVAVKVNGATTFQVPAFGRWSDYSSIAGFTVPGDIHLLTTCKYQVPIYTNEDGGGTDPADVPVTPQKDGTGIGNGTTLLCLNFEGEDGATTWTEEAQGLTPDSYVLYEHVGVRGFQLTTTVKKFGISSVTAELTGAESQNSFCYTIPSAEDGDFTLHGWVRIKQVVWTSSKAWKFKIYFGTNMNHGVSFYNGPGVDQNPTTEGTFHHVAIIRSGSEILYAFDGGIYQTDNDVFVPSHLTIQFLDFLPTPCGSQVWLDAFELVNYAKWTTNFTPPLFPPPLDNPIVTEITSTETITVTDNSLIQAGDTITITGVSA